MAGRNCSSSLIRHSVGGDVLCADAEKSNTERVDSPQECNALNLRLGWERIQNFAPCGVCRKGSSYAKGNLHRESPGSVSARFASTTWLPSFSSIAPRLCEATARGPASVASDTTEHTHSIHAQIGLCGMLWAGQVTLKHTALVYDGKRPVVNIKARRASLPVIVAPFYVCARSPRSTPSA